MDDRNYSSVDIFYTLLSKNTYKTLTETLRQKDAPIIFAYEKEQGKRLWTIPYKYYRCLYLFFNAVCRTYPLFLAQHTLERYCSTSVVDLHDFETISLHVDAFENLISDFIESTCNPDLNEHAIPETHALISYCLSRLGQVDLLYRDIKRENAAISAYGTAVYILRSKSVTISNVGNVIYQMPQDIRSLEEHVQLFRNVIEACQIGISSFQEQIKKSFLSLLTLSDTNLLFSFEEPCMRYHLQPEKEWIHILAQRVFSYVWYLSEYSLTDIPSEEHVAILKERALHCIEDQLQHCDQQAQMVLYKSRNGIDHLLSIMNGLKYAYYYICHQPQTMLFDM